MAHTYAQGGLEEQGVTELVRAINSGVIKVAELGASPSSTLRPVDLDPTDNTDAQNVELD